MNKVLVACEESQVVTIELRKLGIEAYSCDIDDCSGNHPEWHLKCDVLGVLSRSWDMVLAFPPCTHLACSGARWFKQKQKDGRQQQGIDFFMQFTELNCDKVCIENPIGIMSTKWRKPDQIIQPYQFGHKERKATCLWLKGLPKLQVTNDVYEDMRKLSKSEQSRVHYMAPSEDRAKLRSKTYLGIAKAMAEQWG